MCCVYCFNDSIVRMAYWKTAWKEMGDEHENQLYYFMCHLFMCENWNQTIRIILRIPSLQCTPMHTRTIQHQICWAYISLNPSSPICAASWGLAWRYDATATFVIEKLKKKKKKKKQKASPTTTTSQNRATEGEDETNGMEAVESWRP